MTDSTKSYKTQIINNLTDGTSREECIYWPHYNCDLHNSASEIIKCDNETDIRKCLNCGAEYTTSCNFDEDYD